MIDNDKPRGNPDIVELGKDTRWQPGQSGNPAGRPSNTKFISDYLKELLVKQAKTGEINAELIAKALIELSKDPQARGFVPAIKELLDRSEGKVPDTHKLESDVPVTIIFKPAGDKDA